MSLHYSVDATNSGQPCQNSPFPLLLSRQGRMVPFFFFFLFLLHHLLLIAVDAAAPTQF